jgi:hypothetical protein
MLPPLPAPNMLGIHLEDQTSEHQASCSIPQATLGKTSTIPLDRLIPSAKKKQQKNSELKTSAQQREQGLLKAHWRRGDVQGAELMCEPPVNKWQEGHQHEGDRPLPEVGKEQRWQTTGPSPWAPTVRQLCTIEEQIASHNNTLTVAAT